MDDEQRRDPFDPFDRGLAATEGKRDHVDEEDPALRMGAPASTSPVTDENADASMPPAASTIPSPPPPLTLPHLPPPMGPPVVRGGPVLRSLPARSTEVASEQAPLSRRGVLSALLVGGGALAFVGWKVVGIGRRKSGEGTASTTAGPARTTPSTTTATASAAGSSATTTTATTAGASNATTPTTASSTSASATTTLSPPAGTTPPGAVLAGLPTTTLPGGKPWPSVDYRSGKVYLLGALPTSQARGRLVGLIRSVVGDNRVVDQVDVDASVPSVRRLPVRLGAPVLFHTDRAGVRKEHEATIRRCVTMMTKASAATLTVVGHTDSRGSDAYNDVLGLARAQAVRQAIIAAGVDPGRVQAISAGEREPVDDNATLAGRRRNRRVEFVTVDLLDA